jgi:serine beta-lactamase-like protein LACTB
MSLMRSNGIVQLSFLVLLLVLSAYSPETVQPYGKTNAYGSTANHGKGQTSHSNTLSNLTANTVYHYDRVRSVDRAKNSGQSVDATFATTVDRASRPDPDPEPSPEPQPALDATPSSPIVMNTRSMPLVDSAVRNLMSSKLVVGVVAGIVKNHEIIYLKGFGYEDREAQIPVDPTHTKFRWASVSKGVVGVASAIAESEGLINLDVPIETYYEGYQVPATYLPSGCTSASCALPLTPSERLITQRMLLSHVGGIQHYTNGASYPVPPSTLTNSPDTNIGFSWALDYVVSNPLVNVPGNAYSYTTFGLNIAGHVLASAVERNQPNGAWRSEYYLWHYVNEKIRKPAGMVSFQPDYEWATIANRAVGYLKSGTTVYRDASSDVSWKVPGGGFLSTGQDFARYCGALISGVVMPRTDLDQTAWKRHYSSSYGYGFTVSSITVSHGGAQQKTYTYIRIDRGSNECFVSMTNSRFSDMSSSDFVNAIRGPYQNNYRQ